MILVFDRKGGRLKAVRKGRKVKGVASQKLVEIQTWRDPLEA